MSQLSDLPVLPDLEELRRVAVQRRDFFLAEEERNRTERIKAEAILAALGGETPKKSAPSERKPPSASAAVYQKVLTALGSHDYAGLSTLSSQTRLSRSHCSLVMRLAAQRGHVTIEQRRRRQLRFILTEAGQEFLTAPASENGATPENDRSPELTKLARQALLGSQA